MLIGEGEDEDSPDEDSSDEEGDQNRGFGVRKWFYEKIFGMDHIQVSICAHASKSLRFNSTQQTKT